MGKLLNSLTRQLKTENKQDAENCILIYNKLKELNNGSVWESSWNALVSTSFIGSYPNSHRVSKPNGAGIIFIKGLNS